MRRKWRTATLGLIGFALAAPAAGEEGMWTFDNFPSERMREDFGWAPDQAWLDRVMVATARMPGCSGANVSAEGLVVTNQHCVAPCLAQLSDLEHDRVRDGFMARGREEEVRCYGFTVQLMSGVEDVTQRIDAATAEAGAFAFARVRDDEIAAIEAECTIPPRQCEVETLYDGGRYALYHYRRYADVRVVFAPERAMAAFGGEEDNFRFPRFGADFAFVQLYQNGAPAATPGHLSFDFAPAEAGDIVITAGNPGSTSRMRSAAELVFERDVHLPARRASLARMRDYVRAYAETGPEAALSAASALASIDNALKALEGRAVALAGEGAFERIGAREHDLRERVRRNAAAQREMGASWGEIERAMDAYRGIYASYQMLEALAGERSTLFSWARDLVRAADERSRQDSNRAPRYREANRPALERTLAADAPVDVGFEQAVLAAWLDQVRARLGNNDALMRRMFGDETPAQLAHRLAQSSLADPDARVALWRGGEAAIAASDDPMIAFVRAWDADARAAAARYDTQVRGPVARAHEQIARARFWAFADRTYPDATFSPRLSYGRIEGWRDPDGAETDAFTDIDGLFARATGAAPHAVSPAWQDARARLDGATQVNLVSSNDIVGGNSGSPLLNREGGIVAIAFDGNRHSLGGEYFYDGAVNRTVSVAAPLIRAALADVYAMHALLAELEGRPAAAASPEAAQ